MTRYVALLRGIKVAGKNLIKTTDLKVCFEKAGFEDVETYIQSGNVIFSSGDSGHAALTSRIEALLGRAFNYRCDECGHNFWPAVPPKCQEDETIG
ncbi:MAG TPA: DUF1697 domain-containing protein [Longimicrobiales bacterium]|nr:DUF1697 domain-containing protein [Longimicrobiales bacterium]